MLDRNRDFSPIYGDSAAKFYQDGKYFDASGNPVSEEAAAGRNPGAATLPMAAPAFDPPLVGPTISPPSDGLVPPTAESLAAEAATIAQLEANPTPPATADAPLETTEVTIQVTPESAPETIAVPVVTDVVVPTTETTFGTDANGSLVEG